MFADPEAWDQLFLQENSRLIVSDYPLHSLWIQADSANERNEDQFVEDRKEAVFLCKSSPYDLHTLGIEEPFLGLMQRLKAGQSLAAALDTVDWDTEKYEVALVELFRQLREAGAFEESL
jgi:hypothetical protein